MRPLLTVYLVYIVPGTRYLVHVFYVLTFDAASRSLHVLPEELRGADDGTQSPLPSKALGVIPHTRYQVYHIDRCCCSAPYIYGTHHRQPQHEAECINNSKLPTFIVCCCLSILHLCTLCCNLLFWVCTVYFYEVAKLFLPLCYIRTSHWYVGFEIAKPV